MRRILACIVAAPLLFGQTNLDFGDSVLTGWFAPTASRGFPVAITDQCHKTGAHCAVIRAEGTPSAPFGNIMQSFDATAYRGKTVRLRAMVRVEGEVMARAQLWLRVDRPDQQMGFFDNMGDRPIVNREWSAYEINGDIAEDAVRVNIGMMLFGKGAAYISDVSFSATGPAEPPRITERARPLNDRGLANVAAFARLYGYIRFFHPSEEAAKADWEAIAIAGVRVAESAESPKELARKLEDFFRPSAPFVRVYPAGEQQPKVDLGADTKKMISWSHHGFGNGQAMSIYHSERVVSAPPGGKLPDPVVIVLGAGVKAAIPMALYTVRLSSDPLKPSASTARYTAADRATRMGDVIIAWNVFQHFYPYFDVVQADWPGALREGLRAAATSDEQKYIDVLKRMVAALKDGHGYVSGPGFKTAMPLFLAEWIDGRLIVSQTGGQEGLHPGDAVLQVDGRPAHLLYEEIASLSSGATPQWIRYRATNELLGKIALKPSEIEIEPFSAPGTRKAVTLTRKDWKPAASRPEKISELKPGIMYVDLTRIGNEDWTAAIPKLEKSSGIVFDLRGYPRLGYQWMTHLSEKPMTSAQWHVPVVTRPDRVGMKFDRSGEWDMRPSQPYLKAKRAILTDGSAISYAESTMGIIEHYKLADIVGSTTAGTNGNVNPFSLPGGYRISWTGMKVLKHDGSQHHGIGIRPTIPVERTRAGVAAGKDEVLEKALALF